MAKSRPHSLATFLHFLRIRLSTRGRRLTSPKFARPRLKADAPSRGSSIAALSKLAAAAARQPPPLTSPPPAHHDHSRHRCLIAARNSPPATPRLLESSRTACPL